MFLLLNWGEGKIRNISCIRRLLFEGDPLKVDPDFEWSTLMSLVASSKNMAIFERLINHFKKHDVLTLALQYTDPFGNDNALSIAIACNNLKIALRLIELGSPLNNQNFAGFSPLHEVALLPLSVRSLKGCLDTQLYEDLRTQLLARGTDPTLLDNRGQRADQIIQ